MWCSYQVPDQSQTAAVPDVQRLLVSTHGAGVMKSKNLFQQKELDSNNDFMKNEVFSDKQVTNVGLTEQEVSGAK